MSIAQYIHDYLELRSIDAQVWARLEWRAISIWECEFDIILRPEM